MSKKQNNFKKYFIRKFANSMQTLTLEILKRLQKNFNTALFHSDNHGLLHSLNFKTNDYRCWFV